MIITRLDPQTGQVTVEGFPADPAERWVAIGEEILRIMREMFTEGVGKGNLDFDRWVDAAPLGENMRAAVSAARKRAAGG